MTDLVSDERVPTEQEDALYDHMHAGEWEDIDRRRQEAYDPPSISDRASVDPGSAPTPREQFDLDHRYALGRYHADHEAPESERQENTAVLVEDENAVADQAHAEQWTCAVSD